MKFRFLKVTIYSYYHNNTFKTKITKNNMKKLLKIIFGLILTAGTTLLVLPGMPLASWGIAAINLIKGGLTLLVSLIGLVLIIIGFTELKE